MRHRALINSVGGIGLVTALMVATPSLAGVVYDGGGPDQGGQLYAQTPASQAMSFTLAAGANTINGAQWWGGCFPAATCGASPDFQLTVYSNSGGLPGAVVATFDVGAANQTATGAQIGPAGSSWGEYVYTASFAALTLTAGTEFWFGISESAGEPAGTWGAETTSSSPSGQASANFDIITPSAWVLNPQELAFNLTNTPVPEPASLTVLGSALAGLTFMRRRRRRHI